MADLSDLNAAQTVKIAGASSAGTETNFVDATTAGGIHINLRNNAGTEIGTSTTPLVAKAQLQDNSGTAITLGQKPMATSIPVVFPSDQTLTVTSSPLPATGSGFAFGIITTASQNQVPIESTTYTEQTVNGRRSIASSSALDTSAGTGARQIQIIYFDQTGAGPFTETLTLNGTTGVNTVNTNICYIEDLIVTTAGSTGSNAGIITLYTAINKGGSVIATIAATNNQTLWAHHYVPIGKTCYVSGVSFSNTSTAGGNGGTFVLKKTTPSIANSVQIQVSDFNHLFGQNSSISRSYLSPIQIVGPARITMYVSPDSNTSVIQYGSFDYIDN